MATSATRRQQNSPDGGAPRSPHLRRGLGGSMPLGVRSPCLLGKYSLLLGLRNYKWRYAWDSVDLDHRLEIGAQQLRNPPVPERRDTPLASSRKRGCNLGQCRRTVFGFDALLWLRREDFVQYRFRHAVAQSWRWQVPGVSSDLGVIRKVEALRSGPERASRGVATARSQPIFWSSSRAFLIAFGEAIPL